jgi:predicted nucleic acid-binding protein
VIEPDVTLRMAAAGTKVPAKHQLYAPTLWRSDVLSALYEATRARKLAPDAARERRAYVRGLKIRLLGDAVLQRRAWELAEELGLETTYRAEYVALAQLQKCTLASTDKRWLKRVGALVPTAGLDALTR